MALNEEIDMSLALQMQAQFEEELREILLKQQNEFPAFLPDGSPDKSKKIWKKTGSEIDEPQQEKFPVSLVDPSWELIDPNPNLHSMFLTYNEQFFWGRLLGVEVKWSPRMTLCAGVCSYEGRGGLCSIRLSTPLLKLRPRKDFIETLLHEMIHAYLFVTANNRDRDGHGPEFHKHMYRINGIAGTSISVYHSFHDEVNQYRQHIWQCDGPCRKRPPYFGLVKRSMNRVPGPRDPWWGRHQQNCNGSYTKIKEPEGYGVKKRKSDGKLPEGKKSKGGNDIREFFGNSSTGVKRSGNSSATNSSTHELDKFSGSTDSVSQNFLKLPKNINGFGFTGNGNVVKKDVDGATRSNVHGFGKSSRGGRGGGVKGNTTVSGGSTMGGNAKGGSTLGGTARGGRGGATTAMRGGGSKTITVKGKTKTSEELNEFDTSRISSLPEDFVAFKGAGNSLGGPSSTNHSSSTSRLLALANINSPLPSSRSHLMSNYSHSSTQVSTAVNRTKNSESPFPRSLTGSSCQSVSSVDKTVTCPVCNKLIPVGQINLHMDECIGDFDEDMDEDFEESNLKDASNNNESMNKSINEIDLTKNNFSKKVDEIDLTQSSTNQLPVKEEKVNKRDNCSNGGNMSVISLSSDDYGCEQLVPESDQENNRESLNNRNGIQSEEKFPCPVCSKPFTQREINQHLDSHF